MNLSSKMAQPPATYDVISRNHNNRFSLNLCQGVSKGHAHSYRKRQVGIAIRLGKIQEKRYEGVASRFIFSYNFS